MRAAPNGRGSEHSTVEELGQLFKALRESPSFGGANLLAVKLLLALGVRKGELLGAQWSEFDLDSAAPTWRLPASRTKTGEALDDSAGTRRRILAQIVARGCRR